MGELVEGSPLDGISTTGHQHEFASLDLVVEYFRILNDEAMFRPASRTQEERGTSHGTKEESRRRADACHTIRIYCVSVK